VPFCIATPSRAGDWQVGQPSATLEVVSSPRRSSRVTVGRPAEVVLGLALLLLPAVGVAAPTGPERAKMSPRTTSLWASGADRFRAVLHLAAGPDADVALAPRGLAQPKARLDAVAKAQERVLASLAGDLEPGDLEIRHRYRLRPALAVNLSRHGLEVALGLVEVVWVEEAEQWRAHTAEGVPLIGADHLHAAGVTGEGQAVAIVDTGVDYLHPVLGAGAIPNGVVVYGLDTADNDSNPRDCGFHGTAVASVAAGRPHAWGSLTSFAGGVAPGASILAYKASPDDACGTFDSRDVVAAIEDAVLQRDRYNVVALNLSLGGEPAAGPCDGDGPMSSYAAAIEDATAAGVAVVVSSGNGASSTALDAPACLSDVISVASVYDGPVGPIAYCSAGGAGTCIPPYLCQEPGGEADTVPCYANTSRYLDLFAPSELLTAAERSGTVFGFGGTSGAAPYVTGAIALIYQAAPAMDPVRARVMLGLTGHPVTDPDSGVARPRVDLGAAIAAGGVAVGEASIPIPNAADLPARSTAWVDAPGFVESVEVTVKILHGRPRQLTVTLSSPDGTRVRLHDRGAGTTAESSGEYLTGATGIWVTYPTDTVPAESLELLADQPAAGSWTLEVADVDPATAPGVSPRIVAWGLEVTTSPTRRPPRLWPGSLVIPVAVRAAGAGGTFWVTDTRLLNRSLSSAAVVRLYLVPQGADGTSTFHLASLAIAPQALLDLPDVVAGLFGADQVQGNLLLVTEGPDLLATSRTYNTGGRDGTFGQYVPAAAPGASVGAGEAPLVLLQLASGSGSRTNLGLSEVSGSAVTVTVTLRDGGSGAPLGTSTETVQPWSNLQLNDVFAALGTPPVDNALATVEVSAGSGRVVAYASVVDRSTGDAIFVPGSRPVSGPDWVVPIVARAPGSEGTNWVSDLRVLNPTTDPVELRLELRPEVSRGGEVLASEVTVGPGRVAAVDDVAGLLASSASTTGSLRIAPSMGPAPLLVTSRTYNRADEGTFGQYVPAVAPGAGTTGPVTLTHLDGGAGFRTNLGLCEVGGGSMSLRYVLRDAVGRTLGVGTTTLGPYEVRQVNDLHASLGAPEGRNTRVDVYRDAGDGAFVAYASVVDNLSGDAVFIPSY